jgi:hypothetical protein
MDIPITFLIRSQQMRKLAQSGYKIPSLFRIIWSGEKAIVPSPSFQNRILKFFFLWTLIISPLAKAIDGPWRPQSNPSIMSRDFEFAFGRLPLQGRVSDIARYWSSDYWPLYMGGINLRWNTPHPVGFKLKSPRMYEAMRMSQAELQGLAPSEKFDLLNGRYDYPLRKEVEKRVSPRRAEWEGICHGWAAAAINHREPQPKIVTNPDGIEIPFGSSDIKALLSYYYAYHYHPSSTHQMGRRCRTKMRDRCVDDLNPGAFHLVLSNLVGKRGQSFIADIDNGREVWNQAVFSYESAIVEDRLTPNRRAARNCQSMIRVKTKMKVVFNLDHNSWQAANGTPNQTFMEKEYEYLVELGRHQEIIGGQWISKLRPDFLWRVDGVTVFDSLFMRLPLLLNDKKRP